MNFLVYLSNALCGMFRHFWTSLSVTLGDSIMFIESSWTHFVVVRCSVVLVSYLFTYHLFIVVRTGRRTLCWSAGLLSGGCTLYWSVEPVQVHVRHILISQGRGQCGRRAESLIGRLPVADVHSGRPASGPAGQDYRSLNTAQIEIM